MFLILGFEVSAEGDIQFHISSGLQNKLLPKVQLDVYVTVKDRSRSTVDIIACGRNIKNAVLLGKRSSSVFIFLVNLTTENLGLFLVSLCLWL